jgi:hypothetical protein
LGGLSWRVCRDDSQYLRTLRRMSNSHLRHDSVTTCNENVWQSAYVRIELVSCCKQGRYSSHFSLSKRNPMLVFLESSNVLCESPRGVA